jgi:hypothetical protein
MGDRLAECRADVADIAPERDQDTGHDVRTARG